MGTSRVLNTAVAVLFSGFGLVSSASAQLTSHPQLTFGGTGIPNGAVATNDSASIGVLLGLTATSRCSGTPQVCGAPVTNDGINTFFTDPGTVNGLAGWNFDFAAIGANFADFTYAVFYDTNPAVGNGTTGSFPIPFPPFIGAQDSENLKFGFLGGASFDPNASGQYEFDLVATPTSGGLGASSQIFVDVGNVNVVPEPATMSMLGMGLVSLGGLGIKRRRNSRAS